MHRCGLLHQRDTVRVIQRVVGQRFGHQARRRRRNRLKIDFCLHTGRDCRSRARLLFQSFRLNLLIAFEKLVLFRRLSAASRVIRQAGQRGNRGVVGNFIGSKSRREIGGFLATLLCKQTFVDIAREKLFLRGVQVTLRHASTPQSIFPCGRRKPLTPRNLDHPTASKCVAKILSGIGPPLINSHRRR